MEIRGRALEGHFRRTFQLAKEKVDSESRSVELSFSSEAPYKRWFGYEVLGHNSSEIMLDRLASGTHPLLLQHDPDKQIGVIEKAWVGEDKKGRAIVRFAPSTNRLAEEVYHDVKAGIRSLVSVGYNVEKFVPVDGEGKACDEGEHDEEDKTYRAIEWTPFEVSIVSLAADTSIGVGKSENPERVKDPPKAEVQLVRKETNMDEDKKKPIVAEHDDETAEMEIKQTRERARIDALAKAERDELITRREQQRVSEIHRLTGLYNLMDLREKATDEGWSLEKFRGVVLDRLSESKPPKFDRAAGSDSVKTPGQLFIESPRFQEIIKRGIDQSRHDFAVQMPHHASLTRAAIAAGGDSGQLGSFLTMTQALPGIPGILPQTALRVAAIFPTGMTMARRIAYIKEDTFAGAASVVAANPATAVKEAAAKPEASLDLSETYADVEKVAVWSKVTDELLADSDAIRSYIDGRLGYMVEAREDYLLINGNGTAPNIRGLVNTSGIQTRAAGASPTVADAFGQAINDVMTNANVSPDWIVMHPNDWTDLILSKDANGQYYAGGPFQNQYGQGPYTNVVRMFGLPVVLSQFMTEGTALVGAFRLGAQVWRRQGVTIASTNSNDTDFQSNLITIRAEARMGLAVYLPSAFCLISGIA